MTKRILSIITSLALLAISSILLIVYFAFGGDSSTSTLTLSARNITLKVGQSVYNFYQLSDDNATLSFEVSEENIVDINNERIVGLKAGKVTLFITATTSNQMARDSIEIVVVNSSYSYLITPSQNCEFNDNTLYMTDIFCSFTLEVFDMYGQVVLEPKYNYSSNEEVEFFREFRYFTLVAEKDCMVTLDFYEINFEFSFSVIVV